VRCTRQRLLGIGWNRQLLKSYRGHQQNRWRRWGWPQVMVRVRVGGKSWVIPPEASAVGCGPVVLQALPDLCFDLTNRY